MSSFEKAVFADVIKGLEGMPSYIVWEGSEASDKYPHMRERRRREERRVV